MNPAPMTARTTTTPPTRRRPGRSPDPVTIMLNARIATIKLMQKLTAAYLGVNTDYERRAVWAALIHAEQALSALE